METVTGGQHRNKKRLSAIKMERKAKDGLSWKRAWKTRKNLIIHLKIIL